MSQNQEQKNYAALRYSRSFGQDQNKISLAFNKDDIVKWFQDMKPDAKGIVRICIAPRKTPSECNKFTVFQDTWQPTQQAAPRQQQRPAAQQAETDGEPVPF